MKSHHESFSPGKKKTIEYFPVKEKESSKFKILRIKLSTANTYFLVGIWCGLSHLSAWNFDDFEAYHSGGEIVYVSK